MGAVAWRTAVLCLLRPSLSQQGSGSLSGCVQCWRNRLAVSPLCTLEAGVAWAGCRLFSVLASSKAPLLSSLSVPRPPEWYLFSKHMCEDTKHRQPHGMCRKLKLQVPGLGQGHVKHLLPSVDLYPSPGLLLRPPHISSPLKQLDSPHSLLPAPVLWQGFVC